MKGEIFHILNRGVEKRKIFLTERNYLRFIDNLRDFNNKNNVPLSYFHRKKFNRTPYGSRTSVGVEDRLVDILCWSLMPNHFHILAQEKIDRGSGAFTRKVTGGYTLYFNIVNERSGVLFQGKSKIIPIKKDSHFFYLPFYIFSNPIELIEPHWREKGIKDLAGAIKFLENYRYSSFPGIIGRNNSPVVVMNKNLFYELFDTNNEKFGKDFAEWLKSYEGDGFGKFKD